MKAIALNRCTLKQITSRRTALRSSYITTTVDSLVSRGYITKSKSKGYQITKKGTRVLLKFLPNDAVLYKNALYARLHDHVARTKEAIKMIETLGDDYYNQVENYKTNN